MHYILQLNDYPIGIYSSAEKATKAQLQFASEEYAQRQHTRGLYYSIYEFIVDAPAKI